MLIHHLSPRRPRPKFNQSCPSGCRTWPWCQPPLQSCHEEMRDTMGDTTGGTAPAVGSQHSATGARVGWWEPHAPMKNCKSSTTARMVFEKKLSWGFAEREHHPVWFVTVAAAEPKIDRCPQRITGGAELWLLTRISNHPPGP